MGDSAKNHKINLIGDLGADQDQEIS